MRYSDIEAKFPVCFSFFLIALLASWVGMDISSFLFGCRWASKGCAWAHGWGRDNCEWNSGAVTSKGWLGGGGGNVPLCHLTRLFTELVV